MSVTERVTSALCLNFNPHNPRGRRQVVCTTGNSIINNLHSKDPKGFGVRQIIYGVNSDPLMNPYQSSKPRIMWRTGEGRH